MAGSALSPPCFGPFSRGVPVTPRKKPVVGAKILRLAEQLAPHNEEAERAVIGAMILSGRAIEDVKEILVPNEFYVSAHRDIFSRILALNGARKNVDLLTIKNELLNCNKLEEIGGEGYLFDLIESCPSAANALFYATIVRDQAILRALDLRGREISAMAYDTVREDTAHDRAFEALAKIAPLAQLSRDSGSLKTLREVRSVQTKGIPMGLPSVDAEISCGGIPCGQPSIVMAATNVGKTPFLCQVALHNLRAGRRVFYALFADLTPEQLKGRFIKLLSGHMDGGQTLDQAAEYADAIRTIDDPYDIFENLIIYDADSRDRRTIEAFMSEFRRAHALAPFDLVCLDYLQKINSRQEIARTSSARTFDRVSMVADEIEGFSKEFPATAFLLASQITVEPGGKAKARYGAEVVNDASLVLWLDREPGQLEATIMITKSRFGNSGVRIGDFRFDLAHLKFVDPRE